MKIAYLIQAHNNYLHLQKLINALNEPDSFFYIHIDKKSLIPSLKGDNIIFINQRENVYWSGFSQVKATLNLLRAAVINQHDYYAFISGTDYPIKPNTYLSNLLEKGGEYIRIAKGTNSTNPISRYKYFYFTDFYNRRNRQSRKTKFYLWLQQTLRKLKISKPIPFELYVGSSWFVLSYACVNHILEEIRVQKKYIRFYKSAFCPDESFFQTIIGNSKFYHQVKGYLTYTDWSVDPGPAIISENHLPILRREHDKFFARKFDDNSAEIVDLIDRELRLNKKKTYNESFHT